MVANVLFTLAAAVVVSAAAATPRLANPLMHQHDFWAFCWLQLVGFALLSGVIGLVSGSAGYGATVLAGTKGMGSAVGVVAGTVVGQLLVRCDGVIADPASAAGDRQSAFNWLSRYFRGRLYCRLIDKTTDDVRLRDRLANGLVAAYDEFEIGRFLAHAVPGRKRWTDKILNSAAMTPVEKREALADRLLRDSFEFAKGKVKDRAATIVERGGF